MQRPTDGLDEVYGSSLALLTDLYQLSMACGYWKAGLADREAVFHLTYRRAPFGGGYAIAAGIAPALAFLRRLRFTEDDRAFLATLTDATGAATITFNIGGATPNYPVTVHVFTRADDDQQLSWSTSFTPH